MKKRKTRLLVLAIIVAFISAGLFMPGFIGAGNMEPSGPPDPTMKTLDQIPPTWSQKLLCDIVGDCPRFEMVMDGFAMLDKETGLVWAGDSSFGPMNWQDAVEFCYNVGIGGRKGWRMPTVDELASLLDPQQTGPATAKVPTGIPVLVWLTSYWSATTNATDPTLAWRVDMVTGGVAEALKSSAYYVWPVRAGQ